MKKLNIYILTLFLIVGTYSCSSSIGENHEHSEEEKHEHKEGHEEGEHGEEVHINALQFKSIDMEIGELQKMNIGEYVMTNGDLEVPPQHDAAVTTIIGANVIKIKVIEGEKVKKGQVLAYISHPDLISLQTEYQQKFHQLSFAKEEYNRQKKLYDEKVGSGREYQKASASYFSLNGEVKGLEAQLKMLLLNLPKIQEGHIYENIPVVSPLNGYIQKVLVKTGQYVLPQKELFEVISLDDIHVDLMVYEKDISKVEVGQDVIFTTEIESGKKRKAKIFNIGKSFEKGPKAIHLHADIVDQKDDLIPGTYVRGKILINNKYVDALPEAAVVQEGEDYFFFTVDREGDEWSFKPQKVQVGNSDHGNIEVKLLYPMKQGQKVALNNAYYLMAEMKKSEGGHHHH
ncbi:efflux RND transporter periplasmic adaptor subunit [Flammeovirga agarivorans]|uniref:Efflux RND transporter periplasmic adaptor subunit n=1 Tax=Flammeovirga agarivorans TaxID=2726742 RepID=A0A7X8SKY8_9BACT|nr:efflux RND transporter periplasmic adaptor subunit [Flammeovirga agarivorans]NLR92175.1 efflux RND transporter periplasmic adaptor subunit [Flammeovirga agarivorans]